MLRGKTGKSFVFQFVRPNSAIKICRTFKNYFGQFVWIEKKKKSHYNTRVSLHEAPTKNQFTKSLMCTDANIESIFFKKKVDSMVNVLADHKILNVFELFIVEVLQELFKQIRKESSLELSLTFTTGKSISTRRTVKGLLDVPYSGTIVKRKSLSNTMIRAYNWLLDFDLMPEILGDLTKNQGKMYINDISSVYIMNKLFDGSIFRIKVL